MFSLNNKSSDDSYEFLESPLVFFRDILNNNDCETDFCNREDAAGVPTLYALLGTDEEDNPLCSQMYYINKWESQSFFEIDPEEVCFLRMITVFPFPIQSKCLTELDKSIALLNIALPIGKLEYSEDDKRVFYQYTFTHQGPGPIEPAHFLGVFEMYRSAAILILGQLQQVANGNSSHATLKDIMQEVFPDMRKSVLPFPGIESSQK